MFAGALPSALLTLLASLFPLFPSSSQILAVRLICQCLLRSFAMQFVTEKSFVIDI